MNRINISKNARIKAGSELVYPHKKSTPSAAVCNLRAFIREQLVGLEKKQASELLGQVCRHSQAIISSSGRVSPSGFMMRKYIPFNGRSH